MAKLHGKALAKWKRQHPGLVKHWKRKKKASRRKKAAPKKRRAAKPKKRHAPKPKKRRAPKKTARRRAPRKVAKHHAPRKAAKRHAPTRKLTEKDFGILSSGPAKPLSVRELARQVARDQKKLGLPRI